VDESAYGVMSLRSGGVPLSAVRSEEPDGILHGVRIGSSNEERRKQIKDVFLANPTRESGQSYNSENGFGYPMEPPVVKLGDRSKRDI